MAVQNNQPRTKVVETLDNTKGKVTAKMLEDKTGRPLGSPINGYDEGQTFKVTLTGKIEIREFNGQKGAYFTTKQGFGIRVNASFDPAIHKEGAELDCICRVFENADGRKTKFASFAN